jgi:hypothetical protein
MDMAGPAPMAILQEKSTRFPIYNSEIDQKAFYEANEDV